MRQIALVLLLACGISTGTYAQYIETAKVPTSIKRAFSARYPGVTLYTWEKTRGGDYKVNFRYTDTETQATFNRNGWVATTRTLRADQLPISVQSAVESRFGNFDYYVVNEVYTANNGVKYEIEMRHAELGRRNLLFDRDGELIVNVIAQDPFE